MEGGGTHTDALLTVELRLSRSRRRRWPAAVGAIGNDIKVARRWILPCTTACQILPQHEDCAARA